MGKENFIRLQENKEQTKAFIEAHLAQPLSPPPNPQVLYKDVRAALDSSKLADITGKDRRAVYSACIDKLEEARDNEFGILWRRGEPHVDGSRDLIRDARNVTGIIESPVSFVLQAISSIRAVEKIIEMEITDPLQKKQVMQQMEIQREKILALLPQKEGEQVKEINIRAFNFELVNILDAVGVEDSIQKISVAKEILALEDSKFHVTTINQIPGRSELMIESEAMLLGLTSAQIEQYKTIDATPIDQQVESKPHNMAWYNELPDFDKTLVKEYAAQIALGNYILPNQLTKQLIGLRNAYSKATYFHDEKGLELLDEGLHSATISFHGKGDRQEVVAGNIEQVRSFLPLGQDVNINTLNAPGNPTGIEFDICKQIADSQASSGGYRSLTPFARWRIIPGNVNNNSGYEKALTEIAKGLETDSRFTNIASFLRGGQNEKKARVEIEKLKLSDLKLAVTFEHAFESKKLIRDSNKRKLLSGDTDPNNENLTLSARMHIVSFAANKGVLAKFKIDVPYILRHCKSGKDRTGLAEMETTRILILDRLGIADYYGERAKEIFEFHVKGGHTQFITSVNGGSTGTHGIKKDSETAVPIRLYKGIDGIILETASFNKFKATKPKPSAERKLSSSQDEIPVKKQPVELEAGIPNPTDHVFEYKDKSTLDSQYSSLPSAVNSESFAATPSSSQLTARDIMDSQTDSFQEYKTTRNVAIAASALLVMGLIMGGGVIGVFLVVALFASGFAINARENMQQEKQQIAAQKNIARANEVNALQKAPARQSAASRYQVPAPKFRDLVENSRSQGASRNH